MWLTGGLASKAAAQSEDDRFASTSGANVSRSKTQQYHTCNNDRNSRHQKKSPPAFSSWQRPPNPPASGLRFPQSYEPAAAQHPPVDFSVNLPVAEPQTPTIPPNQNTPLPQTPSRPPPPHLHPPDVSAREPTRRPQLQACYYWNLVLISHVSARFSALQAWSIWLVRTFRGVV